MSVEEWAVFDIARARLASEGPLRDAVNDDMMHVPRKMKKALRAKSRDWRETRGRRRNLRRYGKWLLRRCDEHKSIARVVPMV